MEKQKEIGKWKELMVKELSEEISKDTNFYISNYIGLKADEMNELRRLLESRSSKYFVVKNSIAKIVLENAGLVELKKFIDGSVGVIFGGKNPIAAAKILVNFSKAHESLRLKGGYFEGMTIDTDRIKFIASLPSKEELITKILLSIKSPVRGFVSVLGNMLKSFIYVIQAIKNKKGG